MVVVLLILVLLLWERRAAPHSYIAELEDTPYPNHQIIKKNLTIRAVEPIEDDLRRRGLFCYMIIKSTTTVEPLDLDLDLESTSTIVSPCNLLCLHVLY